VYIEKHQGFEVEDKKTHVCRLKKDLYRLKLAPRAWYGRIDYFLKSLGFTKSKVDSNLFFKVMNDEKVILLLYVDDLFLTREEKLIIDCKKKFTVEFEMKYLGLMHYFLGLEVWKSPENIFLNQGKYAVEILKRFDMLECKSMNTPMETKLNVTHPSRGVKNLFSFNNQILYPWYLIWKLGPSPSFFNDHRI
jgi:hypothetical protein